MRRSLASSIAIALILSAAFTVTSAAPPQRKASGAAGPADVSARESRQEFHDAMRKLWEDHITWTRLFIVSKATLPSDLPDIGPTADRLLQNQDDIGAAIGQFYGATAGADLAALLRVHILTAADILTAAKAGDAAAAAAATDAWYVNAHDIAVFLNALNPRHWPLEDMDAMMTEHLDLTLVEAVARLEGRYADDITAYEEIHAQILHMADMLSDGIIRQFPQRFSAR
jgi:hypothetical protein